MYSNDNPKRKRNIIRTNLKETHQEGYNFPYIWENWELIEDLDYDLLQKNKSQSLNSSN
tara:strand:+ start:418 stop:594 length:177 start_codon:yes stop_codon:yes gene_type:complete